MPKGLSLHVGVKSADPSMGFPQLRGCENDAQAMAEIASLCGYRDPRILLGREATAPALLDAIAGASGQLVSGDIFLVTFSGHGSQLRVLREDPNEPDNFDETW